MGARRDLVIGVDFDNTLIVYGELFRRIAAEKGFIGEAVGSSKKDVRDAVRRLPVGEVHWQKLQAAAYGPRIAEARLAEGVPEFLELCWRASAKVYVVSHKTELARYDETHTNLRQAAIAWMRAAGLFRPNGWGPDAVCFGATRQEKIDYIRKLGCTHFIDDLEELFLEESFPARVQKILYAPHPPQWTQPGIQVATSWKQICECLFGSEN